MDSEVSAEVTSHYDDKITGVYVVLCTKDPKLGRRHEIAAFQIVGALMQREGPGVASSLVERRVRGKALNTSSRWPKAFQFIR